MPMPFVNSISRKIKAAPKWSMLLGLPIAAIVLGGGWLAWQNTKSATHDLHYDVVVVGAGPGGIAASIQAARMGAHVALIEETDWVGGQMTAAGVGTMDEGNNNQARKSGLYGEFVQRINALYSSKGKSDSTCYYYIHSLCVDPKDGQVALKQMLAQESSHLKLFTHTKVASVMKANGTVIGVTTANKRIFSKVVIDASEYGDVIAQAGAAYRLGSGTSSKPSPDACIQDITYTAVIKYYPQGVPDKLQFKRPPPGYTPKLQKHFAGIVSNSGTDFMQTKKFPNSFSSYVAWRGLPDLSNPKNYDVLQQTNPITRTVLNLGNDYPVGQALTTQFISDPSIRLDTICQAKLTTLQLAYYIQHDLGQTNWSIADDEGYDTNYNQSQHCGNLKGYEAFEDQMPQEPYIREARRLIGVETLTGQFLSERPWQSASEIPRYKDSIAVGYYPTDLHDCKSASSLEAGLDSANDLPKGKGPGEGPFEVPLGVVIPQKMDGLLAAEKNISTSRLANGAIREQPIAMDIGQAVGALAAISAEQNIQPRKVQVEQVQQALKSAEVIIQVTGNATS